MRQLDLRQVGTIMGLPIYIDVASVSDFRRKGSITSERDRKIMQVTAMIRRAFEMSGDVLDKRAAETENL